MKLFAFLILFSSLAFAKNKVLYTVMVPTTDPKKPPLYDLFVMNDFKVPSTKNLERGRFKFATTSDVIAYTKEDSPNLELYVITNFTTYNKIQLATQVVEMKIQNNSLFYVQLEKQGERTIRNLYVVTDFKTLNKTRLQTDISDFIVDEQ